MNRQEEYQHIRRGRAASLSFLAVLVVAVAALLAIPGEPAAKMKGRCRDCHAMHAKEPFPALTRNSCLGCHGMDPAGPKSIIQVGKTRIPQVIHRQENGDLAAGNFYYIADAFTSDYRNGHNLAGLSRPETPPKDFPPGFEGEIPVVNGVGPALWPTQQQVNCSGTYGCHGDRTIGDPDKAMSGAHHEDDRVLDGETVGRSYRFLNGVKGVEHSNWEYLATIDNHNGYKGDPTHTQMDTISYVCAQCHSKFHPNPYLGGIRDVGTAYYSVWVRHPADIAFSAMHTKYAGSEYQDFTRYSVEVPVGFPEPTGKEETVDITSIVICLSCHRAHASPYPDSLRWDYDVMLSQPGTQGSGCLTCHTRKGGMGLPQ